jgi:low affinity Fe/Cu permease
MDSIKFMRIVSTALLFAFVCLIICIAVWILSGDIQNWMKVIVYAITFAILLPLIHHIRKNKIYKI